jgi:hypothetical protein
VTEEKRLGAFDNKALRKASVCRGKKGGRKVEKLARRGAPQFPVLARVYQNDQIKE